MADGDELVIGENNQAQTSTHLVLTLGSSVTTLLKVDGSGAAGNGASIGVQGKGQSIGVQGEGGTGIKGEGSIGIDGAGGIGVRGISTSQEGVVGFSDSYIGVSGNSKSYNGVEGASKTGIGVRGSVGPSPFKLPSKVGVLGESQTGNGVHGHAFKQTGVVGHSALGTGISGISEAKNGVGVFGQVKKGPDSYAGLFQGNVFVLGDFTKTGIGSSVAVRFPDRSFRLLYSIESPESWFEDFGEGRLVKGKAEVKIDPEFAQTVNLNKRYYVFVTPHSTKISGLAVVARLPDRFRIEHAGGGNGTFAYRIVAKRADTHATRLKRVKMPDSIGKLVKV